MVAVDERGECFCGFVIFFLFFFTLFEVLVFVEDGLVCISLLSFSV